MYVVERRTPEIQKAQQFKTTSDSRPRRERKRSCVERGVATAARPIKKSEGTHRNVVPAVFPVETPSDYGLMMCYNSYFVRCFWLILPYPLPSQCPPARYPVFMRRPCHRIVILCGLLLFFLIFWFDVVEVFFQPPLVRLLGPLRVCCAVVLLCRARSSLCVFISFLYLP